jgi:RNase P/RNase MRP subunit p29
MIDLIGQKVAVLQCTDKGIVGAKGIFALETMKTITIVSGRSKRTMPKLGTVIQLQDGGRIIVGDELEGRLEDRLARGAKA